jgi:hypothetical protein
MNKTKRERINFFIYAIIAYPICYIGAMFIASIVLYYLLGWNIAQAKNTFLVTSIVMGLGCYVIHFKLFAYAFYEAFLRK